MIYFNIQNAVLYLQTKHHGEIQQDFKQNVQTLSATNSATKSATKVHNNYVIKYI